MEKSISIARARLAPFLHRTFLPLSSRSLLPLCVSPSPGPSRRFLRRGTETEKRWREERRRWRSANAFGGQSVIFISESFAPFVRNPMGTLSTQCPLPRAPSKILFLFTFAAAEVGSCSRPILSPRELFAPASAHTISLDRETRDEVRESVPLPPRRIQCVLQVKRDVIKI